MLIIYFCLFLFPLLQDGVHVLDEKHFILNGDTACTLDWSDYDLHIEVPEGSLSPEQKIDICTKAIVAGDFKMPSDCYLVSGIYQIICPEMFSKKVTLHLSHAAFIDSEEEASHFRFYAARCSTGPPYEFKELKGGSFTAFNQHASIKVCQFSYYSVGKKGKVPKQNYFSCLFYQLITPVIEWNVYFVVVKNDRIFTNVS